MLLLVGVACVSAMTVENVQEKFSHVQEIDDDGDSITGTYKWFFLLDFPMPDSYFFYLSSNLITNGLLDAARY